MNNPVISEIYKTTDGTEDFPYKDIPSLINQLSNPDDSIRIQSREALTCIGAAAIPELIKTLSNANTQLRWEFNKVLDLIHDPTLYLSWWNN